MYESSLTIPTTRKYSLDELHGLFEAHGNFEDPYKLVTEKCLVKHIRFPGLKKTAIEVYPATIGTGVVINLTKESRGKDFALSMLTDGWNDALSNAPAENAPLIYKISEEVKRLISLNESGEAVPVVEATPEPVAVEETPEPVAVEEPPEPVAVEEPPEPVAVEEPPEPVVVEAAPVPPPAPPVAEASSAPVADVAAVKPQKEPTLPNADALKEKGAQLKEKGVQLKDGVLNKAGGVFNKAGDALKKAGSGTKKDNT